jgi:hypothetical protein
MLLDKIILFWIPGLSATRVSDGCFLVSISPSVKEPQRVIDTLTSGEAGAWAHWVDEKTIGVFFSRR